MDRCSYLLLGSRRQEKIKPRRFKLGKSYPQPSTSALPAFPSMPELRVSSFREEIVTGHIYPSGNHTHTSRTAILRVPPQPQGHSALPMPQAATYLHHPPTTYTPVWVHPGEASYRWSWLLCDRNWRTQGSYQETRHPQNPRRLLSMPGGLGCLSSGKYWGFSLQRTCKQGFP